MGRVIAVLMIAEVELRRQLTLPGLRRGCEASRPDDPNRLVWPVSQRSGRLPIKSVPLSICRRDQIVPVRPKRHAFSDINGDEGAQDFRFGGVAHAAAPAYCQGERWLSRPNGPIRLIWSVSSLWEQAPIKSERLPIGQIDQSVTLLAQTLVWPAY